MDLNGDGKFDGRDFLLHEEFFGDKKGDGGNSGGGGPGCLIWIAIGLLALQFLKWFIEIFD